MQKEDVPLKNLSNFWQWLEMYLINCKIQLELSWTKNCRTCNVAVNMEFKIKNKNSVQFRNIINFVVNYTTLSRQYSAMDDLNKVILCLEKFKV